MKIKLIIAVAVSGAIRAFSYLGRISHGHSAIVCSALHHMIASTAAVA
jgi:hypothetical protein